MSHVCETGIYYGYAQVLRPKDGHSIPDDDAKVHPMVMSLGWNPFYKNERLTAVNHIQSLLKASY